MKFAILSLLAFLFYNFSLAQAPAITWQKTLGGSTDDTGMNCRQTRDGGYIVVGQSNSNDHDVSGNHGHSDYWVVKSDALGNIKWQHSYGGSGYEFAMDVVQTNDNGYVVVGTTSSNDGQVSGNHGANDFWVIKIDSVGTLLWQKCYGGSSEDFPNQIIQTRDNCFLIAGGVFSNNGDVMGSHGNYDYWLIKIDSTGSLLWQKTYGGSMYDMCYSVFQTNDGGYVTIGETNSTDGDLIGNVVSNGWLLKIDSVGNKEWGKLLSTTTGDRETGQYVEQTSDMGFIIAATKFTVSPYVDYHVIKLDKNANLQWEKTLGSSADDFPFFIHQTADRGYCIGGYTRGNDQDINGKNHGSDDYWLVKLDSSGNFLWQKTLGGSNSEIAKALDVTDDGGYIVMGYTASNDGDVTGNHGGVDFWLVKLGPDPSNVMDIKNNIFAVYPNPTSSSLQFPYKFMNIAIYNNEGKKVSECYDADILNIQSLPLGMYYIQAFTYKNELLNSSFIKR